MATPQELRDKGLNVYKKSSRGRTLWIGGSVSVFGLIGYLLLLTGVSETHTGDITCGTVCESYVNLTTTYWNICFDETLELVTTTPKVSTELYVPTLGNKWRLFDPSKDCITRGKINRFKIVGYKEPYQTVKWTFDINSNFIKDNVDPVWGPISLGGGKYQILLNDTSMVKDAEVTSQSGGIKDRGSCGYSRVFVGDGSEDAVYIIWGNMTSIPSNKLVDSAYLRLYFSSATTSNVNVSVLNHYWQEGTCCQTGIPSNSLTCNGTTAGERWYGDNANNGNTPFDATDPDWQTSPVLQGVGIDYNRTPFKTNFSVTGTQYVTINITNITKYWHNGSITNYGLILEVADIYGGTPILSLATINNETNDYFPTFNITYMDGPNVPPTQGTPFINMTDSPRNRTTANMTAYNVSTSDIDGDNVSNIYRWYKDNVEQLNLRNLTLITTGNFTSGEVWYVNITPNDGEDNGTTSQSNSITIVQANTAPTHSNPILNATDKPYNTTVGNISCYNQSTSDYDWDLVYNTYRWYRNGAENVSLRNKTMINLTSLWGGDSWNCTITPYDGTENGTTLTSNTLLINLFGINSLNCYSCERGAGDTAEPFVTYNTTNWFNLNVNSLSSCSYSMNNATFVSCNAPNEYLHNCTNISTLYGTNIVSFNCTSGTSALLNSYNLSLNLSEISYDADYCDGITSMYFQLPPNNRTGYNITPSGQINKNCTINVTNTDTTPGVLQVYVDQISSNHTLWANANCSRYNAINVTTSKKIVRNPLPRGNSSGLCFWMDFRKDCNCTYKPEITVEVWNSIEG